MSGRLNAVFYQLSRPLRCDIPPGGDNYSGHLASASFRECDHQLRRTTVDYANCIISLEGGHRCGNPFAKHQEFKCRKYGKIAEESTKLRSTGHETTSVQSPASPVLAFKLNTLHATRFGEGVPPHCRDARPTSNLSLLDLRSRRPSVATMRGYALAEPSSMEGVELEGKCW
ncbi:hypothetical protein PCASD_22171 [Puccinia coronata f. sp. avenae]|uniref:Uncharacterized protein n=1 Tax=Puccinia coronata f. sp. avenae TaxID=200324 RepID=A0A2N5SR44_9BASI|nr:hypothetical protein PCASD_22171 [Puccinia coronata f. sp. avenae]